VRPNRPVPDKNTPLRAPIGLPAETPPPGHATHGLRASGAKPMAPAGRLNRLLETRPSRQRVEAQRKIESARTDIPAPLTPPRARPTTDSSEARSPAIFGDRPPVVSRRSGWPEPGRTPVRVVASCRRIGVGSVAGAMAIDRGFMPSSGLRRNRAEDRRDSLEIPWPIVERWHPLPGAPRSNGFMR
jgi:hypothetical protein